ncbi:endonuclease domain-containing 1 protein-like [Acridotheres tristis]
MLGLLLLQVLASCLWLGHSEVVKSFTRCPQFFYEDKPPNDVLRPTNAARICQVYANKYRFATLYDRNRRIPVYSAYKYKRGPGDRYDSWFVEPQLINETYDKSMDEEASIIEKYNITSAEIGLSQAIDQDYKDAVGLDRGHLCPSGHQNGNDSKWATFTLTNIVPQDTDFNQGTWHDYEEVKMPEKTQGCDTTYVITGAVPGNTYISNGRVNVPSYIWSAACCLEGKNPIRAWGAIAKNERNQSRVKIIDLTELEMRLAKHYNMKGVNLFKNACGQKQASHP